jgi:hypothetical protein
MSREHTRATILKAGATSRLTQFTVRFTSASDAERTNAFIFLFASTTHGAEIDLVFPQRPVPNLYNWNGAVTLCNAALVSDLRACPAGVKGAEF